MSDMIHLLYDGKIEQSAEPAQMYARPATKFAASFIGSYNIISSEEFQKMTGTKAESETIAFRREMFTVMVLAVKEPKFMQKCCFRRQDFSEILRNAG